jgi:hypothetical protein
LDTCYDDFSDVLVGGVVGHPEGLEAFPCPALWVPKIFDSGVAKIDNGASFIKTTYSQGRPVVLRMRRLLKMGCLKTFAWDAGLDFVRPTLKLSQEPRMLFQNEHFICLSLGVVKNQFMSLMLGLYHTPGDEPDLLGASESLSRVLLLGQVLSLEVWQVVLWIVPWGL